MSSNNTSTGGGNGSAGTDITTTGGGGGSTSQQSSNGTSNGTRRNHQNHRNRHRSNHNQNTMRNFTPKDPAIESLGTASENSSQDFTKFQKSLNHKVVTTYEEAKYLSKAILNFKDPQAELEKERLTISQLRVKHNYQAIPSPGPNETADKKFAREQENEDRRQMVTTLFGTHVKSFDSRKRTIEQGLIKLWGTIIGQCTPALQEEISGSPDYSVKLDHFDSIWLLQTVQKLTAGANKTTNQYLSAFKALKAFYTTTQQRQESVDSYFSRFENARTLVQLFESDVIDIDKLYAAEKKNDPTVSREHVLQKFLAVSLVMNASTSKYEALWNKLENDLLVGVDSYPTTIGAATHLLTNWKGTSSVGYNTVRDRERDRVGNNTTGDRENVSFAQLVPIPDNNDFSALPGYDAARPTMVPSRKPPHNITAHIICSKCSNPGHYASACPFLVGTDLFQCPPTILGRASVHFTQQQIRSMFAPGAVIVDSGSTYTCFRDKSLLSDIQSCAKFTMFSNGGDLGYESTGFVTALPALDAYHNDECMVNIISLDRLQEKYHTRYDSEKANAFYVDVGDRTLVFQGFGTGLYVLNLNNVSAYSFLNTVAENQTFYSNAEIKGANVAREQQGQLGWPSDRDYYEYISKNLFKNSRCNIDDLRRAEHIHGGTAVEILKGKTVYKPVNNTANITKINIPPIIQQTHPNDELLVDFIYIQRAPYLLINSKIIDFNAVQVFHRISKIITRKNGDKKITYKRGPKDIIAALERIISVFKKRGFKITMIHADNEFRAIEDRVSVDIEICAAGQHIHKIERKARTVKERVRCFYVSLPFKKVPKIMIDECVCLVATCLNDFPSKKGISKTLSPGTIVLGRDQVDGNHLKGVYGRYYEVYIGTDNTNKQRRASCICLRPSNSQGGYYFMNLETGKRIHGYRFTELAMSNHIIERVHELAEMENAPDLDEDGCPIFEWEIGVPINSVDDDEEQGDIPQDNFHDDYGVLTDTDEDDEIEHIDDDLNPDDQPFFPEGEQADETEDNNVDDDESVLEGDKNDSDAESLGDGGTLDDTDLQEVRSVDEEGNMSEVRSVHEKARSEIDNHNIIDGKRTRNQASQPNIASFGGKKYHANMLQIGEDAFAKFESVKVGLFSTTLGICFNQMNAKQGIKLLGKRAIAAMFKEYQQLDDLKVVGRIDPSILTPEQKRRALRAVNLIKVKRCGKVKGRTCADGSEQRKYIPREEASSPTLSLEALMGLLLIAGFEKRKTAVFDVPGAYLHADMNKFALLKLEGEFVDIMCEVNPEFKDDVRYENGKKVLYVQILKALYGMIESALLWYRLYTEILQKEGFELNPYDKCVANKTINGKQCTLAWYVDDNFLSHVDDEIIDDILKMVEGYFPGLSIERGNTLSFLGMEIEFLEDGKFKLGLVQYMLGMIEELEELLSNLGEKLQGHFTHPASKDLFTVRDDAPVLDDKRAEIFGSFVAKLIWVMKRARPDAEPSVSFLCTRVKQPNKDDWKKFLRVMSWIKATAHDVRIIGADDLLEMLVLIDSAHAVHKDMRGHTGGIISFGTGLVDQKSSKQKMNTRSSTETEHVGTSEYLTKPLFFELFMEAQGYKPKITLGKDNESEIRMLINGKDSCTSNSKHVAIKYFWSTDRIQAGRIKVRHCPTDKMIADYMSKPLQGKLFHLFRNVIMGWAHINTLYDFFGTNEERVENNGSSPVINGASVSKQSYTDVAKLQLKVEEQNKSIMENKDPTDGSPIALIKDNPELITL